MRLIGRNSTPPGEQANYERWSLVYFSRPNMDVLLRALTEESSTIAEAVNHAPNPSAFDTGETAAEWLMRRVRNRRAKNMTVRIALNFVDKKSLTYRNSGARDVEGEPRY